MKLRIRKITYQGGTVEYVVERRSKISFWKRGEWEIVGAFLSTRAAEKECEELILNRTRQLATKIQTLKRYKVK